MNQVSQWLYVKESYIHNLEENLAALETTMEELRAKRDDLSRRVEREENKGLRRVAQIQVWLTRVETIESQVDDLFGIKTTELERLCLCGFCSKSLKLRMSLMANKFGGISGTMECLQLTTLFFHKNDTLVNISGDFFRSMPRLVVSDLSFNRQLSDLPDGISELVSLRYLNLSFTDIQSLPVGLRELKNLIHLDLEGMFRLSSVAGISALLKFKVLKLQRSNVSYGVDTMEELQVLEHLEILTIGVNSDSDLDRFLSSHKLMRCTQALVTVGCELESSDVSVFAGMEKLRELVCFQCTFPEKKMDITRSIIRSSAWF